ncbi:hypothetical protein [Streptomyces aidingensis]|uniref:DUF4352 domain-containing protein n=1 Tax=Streptomyces aidingensis TaxID=910347 RepID=A0A1I1ENH0_9ACTN|nr:hypothetical protein [Streptomyces aidingensis]SFB88729.1 hypothetical protein SAMN05421773_101390 [Streptomyces aidingensis]
MNLRDGKTRLILIAAALGIALVVAVASCGGGEDDGGEQKEDGQSQETANTGEEQPEGETSDNQGGEETEGGEESSAIGQVTTPEGISITFTRAEREDGGFLTIEGSITNNGSERLFDVGWAGPEKELAENGFSMAGATLTARTEGKRYLILRDTTGRCLCTGFAGSIKPGETVSWFAQFPAPDPATDEVDFQIGTIPAVTLEIQ